MASGAAVFVMGPAGSGKSTFCTAMLQHCESIGRTAHLFNLDPAADNFEYEPTKDIRELISVEDVMEEFGLGPNGGLMYCLEFLVENAPEWLESDLGSYADVEFIIVDCPGQIELYTHSPVMRSILGIFERAGYRVCVVYLIESLFVQDVTKYFAGVLNATAAMLQMGVPHINVLSKMDLLKLNRKQGGDDLAEEFDSDEEAEEEDEKGKEEEDSDGEDYEDEQHQLHPYIYPDPALLLQDLSLRTRPHLMRLNSALVQLLDEHDMVQFVPLNVRRKSSLTYLLSLIDHVTQYAEGLEPAEPKFDDSEEQ